MTWSAYIELQKWLASKIFCNFRSRCHLLLWDHFALSKGDRQKKKRKFIIIKSENENCIPLRIYSRMTLCRRDEKLEINSISIISLTPCEICACACAMKNNKISIWDVKKMCMCTKPRLKVTSFHFVSRLFKRTIRMYNPRIGKLFDYQEPLLAKLLQLISYGKIG